MHNCSSPVCTAASLQLDTTIADFYVQELYPNRQPAQFAIVNRAPELEVTNGYLRVPDRPGLGVELVGDRVRPFLWATV